MYSQTLTAETPSSVTPSPAPRIEPLDAQRFEQLTAAEAESLLSSRFQSFIARGWDWKDALMLAVRPDGPAAAVPHSGDVSRS
jgi:hypothetical protein